MNNQPRQPAQATCQQSTQQANQQDNNPTSQPANQQPASEPTFSKPGSQPATHPDQPKVTANEPATTTQKLPTRQRKPINEETDKRTNSRCTAPADLSFQFGLSSLRAGLATLLASCWRLAGKLTWPGAGWPATGGQTSHHEAASWLAGWLAALASGLAD